ncbi:RNA dependent RNA polymerase-domain-containing protein [Xylariaceae sp. FL0016]|nr:RNA dependent RNA polymerase-domain-containing protein [Xylariaceae sp. FL0016]
MAFLSTAGSPSSSASQASFVSALSAPQTPSKESSRDSGIRFDVWFLEFSNLYNLNLRIPKSNLTPQQKKHHPKKEDFLYYDRCKVLYYKRKSDELSSRFERGVRDIHYKWVRKPLGEKDVTPARTELPPATTEPERRQLLKLLDEILLDLRPPPESSHSLISSRDARSWQPTSIRYEDPPSPSLTRHAKRQFDDWAASNPSPKRNESIVITEETRSVSALSNGDEGTSSLSGTFSRPTLSFDLQSKYKRRRQQGMYQQSQSVNTSKSSFVSRVFSEDNDQDVQQSSQETQVTVEASAPEKIRQQRATRSQPPPSSDIDSLAPSSSTELALNISFDTRNQIQHQHLSSPDQSYSDMSLPLDLDFDSYDQPIPFQFDATARKGYIPTSPNETHESEPRLQKVWPVLPSRFDHAPLAVRWEMLRIALHCGVATEDIRMEYDDTLLNQSRFWERCRDLPVFQVERKDLPERSRSEAWVAALNENFLSNDQVHVVVLSATLTFNPAETGPLFHLQLQPLRLDLPHRLDRRFGSDRFIELVMPATSSHDMKRLGEKLGDPNLSSIRRWLVRSSHVLLGRVWSSFCIKDASPRKIHKDDTLRPETKVIQQERVYLFAEDGNDFVASGGSPLSSKGETFSSHTKMGRYQLLDWLLQIPNNQEQPILKLFQRIPLGLSRTWPTVLLEPEQIRHLPHDILSPTGKNMNDGIARMSPALARKVRDIMGLSDIPAGYQGRFGSAKGFWIRDTTDMSDNIWIETAFSQRKWICDYSEADHRTFEVRNEAKELKSASLNLQLLPIFEDRAINPSEMKKQIGEFLRRSLSQEMELQKVAMGDPLLFKLWVCENSPARRQDRVRAGHVPWLGGLPINREDQMEILLNQGFDPTKLEFLRKMAYDLRKEKCEELQTKLNVNIGRSTYAYMVVDFLGVLKEDEVHLGFSSKFSDERSGFSETFLHGMDILVARTPAHYPSDIQKVKAVFKPELGSLKDVIIFPTTGNTPLADKLSGGDYDGDIAWVCWEPTIVENFQNAPTPVVPDLFEEGYLNKHTLTFESLAPRHGGPKEVITEFLDQAFEFNMEPNLLGTCTNYKEKLCYSRGSVQDEYAIFLSTLISHLVDRAKQGIIFTEHQWNAIRKDLNAHQRDPYRSKQRQDPPAPEYKNSSFSGRGTPNDHLIDYVKFVVGKPTVEKELRELNVFLGRAEHFDEDLVRFYKHYEKFKRPDDERRRAEASGVYKPTTWERVFKNLEKDIHAVVKGWRESSREEDFEAKLSRAFDRWQAILPSSKVHSNTVKALREERFAALGLSVWDLLKASFCFKMYYRSSFPWYVAGHQLGFLKAMYTGWRTGDAGRVPPVLLTPGMYAGSKPDAKFVRAIAALGEGRKVGGVGDRMLLEEELRDDDV